MPRKCSFTENTTECALCEREKMNNQFTEKKIVRKHCHFSLDLLCTSQEEGPIEAVRERARLAKKKLNRRTRENGTVK